MPKTISIPLDKITMNCRFKNDGEYDMENGGHKDGSYWNKATLLVGNRNVAGYGLGFTPEGFMTRTHTGGPFVPGPLGHAWAHAAVLDERGGTKAELDEAEGRGLLYRAELGDVLDLGGTTFRIDPDHNNNIKLVRVIL